jgi:hypothetical protein
MPLLQAAPRKYFANNRQQAVTKVPQSACSVCYCCADYCRQQRAAAGTAHTNSIITHTESAEGKRRPNLCVSCNAALSTVMTPLAGSRPTAHSINRAVAPFRNIQEISVRISAGTSVTFTFRRFSSVPPAKCQNLATTTSFPVGTPQYITTQKYY